VCLAYLDAKEPDEDHSQEFKAVPESSDVCGAIGPFQVADRQIDHSQVKNGGRKQQFEIAKRIERPETARASSPLFGTPLD
jgi:hypothetical protein